MVLGALVLLLAGAVGVAVVRVVAARRLARFQAGRPGAGYALALGKRAGLGLRLVLAEGLAHGQAAYLPERRELVLSRAVWEGKGVWAAVVAAHEVGHAVDHGRGGLPAFLLAANGASGRLLLLAWGSAVLVLVLSLV
ncbi:MAG: zinc metallopeptidase, partial [Bacillota bacterium]